MLYEMRERQSFRQKNKEECDEEVDCDKNFDYYSNDLTGY